MAKNKTPPSSPAPAPVPPQSPPANPPAIETKGLSCSNCGCKHMDVAYTRPATGKRVLRRRRCRNCKRLVFTTEKVMGAS